MRKTVVTAAVLVALVAGALPARAADPFVFTRSDKKKVKVGDHRATKRIACPKGTRVIGGGVEVLEAFTVDVALVQSAPFDGKDGDSIPDDGWLGSVNNKGDVPAKMRVVAICSKAFALTYEVATTFAFNGQRTEIDATCPGDSVVIGGGVANTGGDSTVELSASVAFDDADMGTVASDGWRGAINNDSGGTLGLSTFAICAADSGLGILSHESYSGSVPGDDDVQVLAGCGQPGFVMIGGGMFFGTTETDIHIESMAPVDGDDADKKLDDGWHKYARNAGPNAQPFGMTYICWSG